MLNIKKVICVVSILLVSVLCLSIIIRTTSIGSAGLNDDNGYSGIGLPDNGVEIFNSAAPITSYDLNGGIGSTLSYKNFQNYSLIEGSSEDIYPYFRFNFAKNADDYTGFNLSDYFYYKVEFDIAQVAGYNPSNCSFYLIARDFSQRGDILKPSKFTIKYDESDKKMVLKYGDQIVKASSFHIEYVIEANPLDLNMSRIQFFVNGKLIPETEYNEIIKFPLDLYYFSELRANSFDENGGKLIVKDLKITGYAKE